jgi:hypothetical protein
MTRLMTPKPPGDGGYPFDSDLHQMSDDGGPVGPDPARWADPVWRDSFGELDTFADDEPSGAAPASDSATSWTPITGGMPPEGVIVEAITAEGRHLHVKWEGRVWRLPGGAHQPYFTPEYWRRV